MSIISKFKEKKIEPNKVVVSIPKDAPEIEVSFNRISSMEYKYLYSSLFVPNKDGEVELNTTDLVLKTFEKLLKKIDSFKILNEDDAKIDKKELVLILEALPLDETISVVNQYNDALMSDAEKND